MKKTIFSTLTAIFMFTAYSSIANEPTQNADETELEILDITQITEADLSEILDSQDSWTSQIESRAFRVKKGTKLPLRVFLKGELFSFESDADHIGYIECLEEIAFRFTKNELLISKDGINLIPFQEYVTGSVSVGFNSLKDTPEVVIGAEVNKAN